MQNGNPPTTLRRSSRVPAAVSVLVTTLEGMHFSEVCQTLVVNAHGCAMLSRRKLESGIPVHFHSKDGRQTTAHVVSCQPIGPDNRTWKLGATLDQPQNFWGLRHCPPDWALPAAPVSQGLVQTLPPARKASRETIHPSEAALDHVAWQLEAQVAMMIRESLRPIQSEVTELKEKLTQRQQNPSRFEVSLSSIPPELEQQLEQRLRQDLGPRVMEDARRQYSHLLADAKTAIEQKTKEGQEEFLRRAAGELQVVEQRAQDISKYISENATEHLRRGLDDFQQRLLDGGNSLKRLSEELLEYLQRTLNDESNVRYGELEQFRARVASESSRLHDHIEYIDVRIRKLEEATRSLESGLDQRLNLMCSNFVKDTRGQLEAVATAMTDELGSRGAQTLGDQLNEARANMHAVQQGLAATASESLKAEVANAMKAFEQSMAEAAEIHLERCRRRLADGLNALAKSLDEQFQAGSH